MYSGSVVIRWRVVDGFTAWVCSQVLARSCGFHDIAAYNGHFGNSVLVTVLKLRAMQFKWSFRMPRRKPVDAFNALNRQASHHNIIRLCASIATTLINSYRNPSEPFVKGSTI